MRDLRRMVDETITAPGHRPELPGAPMAMSLGRLFGP
jgi:hypothetical protein